MADKGLQPIPSGLSQNDFLAAINDRLKRISNLFSAATPTNSLQVSRASADIALTTTAQNVPGANIVLAKAGRYLVLGVFDFIESGAGDVAVLFSGLLAANGARQTQSAIFVSGATTDRATVAQHWLYIATVAGQTLQLQALKSGGSGTSAAKAANTTICALWLGSN